MEYGLCCLFKKENIKFKTFTLTNFSVEKAYEVYDHNIIELQKAIDFCHLNKIKSYRVSSDILPKFGKLHREKKIEVEPYLNRLKEIDSYDLILSMHPDQFVNIGSPKDSVVSNSVEVVKDHILLSKYLKISDINIHIGGSYGDKAETKKRFIENMLFNFNREELNLITIENDEFNYSLDDTLEVAEKLSIRVTYDIHHERCFHLKSKKKVDETAEKENFFKARESWRGYGYQRVHLSSPRDGYTTPAKSRPHNDYIDINDFPKWLKEYDDVHIDIEAKAKELAIKDLSETVSTL